MYNVVIFILLYFEVCNETLVCVLLFHSWHVRPVNGAVSTVPIYSLGIDLSCDLTCVAAQKTRSLYYHVMRNSNWLDRIGQC